MAVITAAVTAAVSIGTSVAGSIKAKKAKKKQGEAVARANKDNLIADIISRPDVISDVVTSGVSPTGEIGVAEQIVGSERTHAIANQGFGLLSDLVSKEAMEKFTFTPAGEEDKDDD